MKTILIVTLIASNLFLLTGIRLLSMTRAEAVTLLTKIAVMRKPELNSLPTENVFTDISDLPAEQQRYIELARTIGITAGTSKTTFSPNEIAPFWQWSILYGKMIMAIH